MTELENRWIGRRFGRLTVSALYAHGDKRHPCKWLCICDCGREKIATTVGLLSKDTKSCGCLRVENATKTGKRNAVHGQSKANVTLLYRIWTGMKTRCTNKRSKDYNRYGGRGITICDAWLNDFVEFREWALQNGYSDNLSIDRNDVNGSYTPDNCRWATAKEQARNRRNTKQKGANEA